MTSASSRLTSKDCLVPLSTSRIVSPLALAAGVSFVLAACTATPPGDPDGPGADATQEESSGAANAPSGTEPADGPSREPSPLEEIFGGAAAALSSDSAEERAAKHLQLEEGIAACMAEQGFTYHVVPLEADEDEGTPGWTTSALLETGYGVSTQPGDYVDDIAPHPNDALRESMAEAELAAFELALGGPVASDEDFAEYEGEGFTDVPLEERGCVGKVEFELYGDVENVISSGEFGSLFQEMAGLYQSVEDNPRAAEVRNAWSGCVADAGFPGLSARWEAAALIEDEWYRMWGEDEPNFSDPKTVEFRERELSLARADVECTESVDLDAVTTELNHEAERAFIELHRAELEALAAALTEQNSR